ncbi:MAG: putative lipoprotein [Labilithrix sp.]|nr:putative lipoprotein [Labilithrix sp.]
MSSKSRMSSALGAAALGVTLLACSSDPTSTGKGTERFSTWGEAFVEQGIPAGDGESGFVDGWSLKYGKFLVVYSDIQIADAAGNVVATLDEPRFVDNVKPGVKELVTFPGLEARAFTQVSYAIKPAVAGAVVVAGDPADLAMMVQKGYSLYVEGKATKPDPADPAKTLTKTFAWGLKTQTGYHDCHAAEENGISTEGVVITSNQTDESQLTTHGDHFFYDSLQSGDNAKPTRIRFDEKAAADDLGDKNGDITLAELCKANIDPSLYNTSGLPGSTIGDFVISLARTVGHYRGEGECTIKRIDAVPAGVASPCDEYR